VAKEELSRASKTTNKPNKRENNQLRQTRQSGSETIGYIKGNKEETSAKHDYLTLGIRHQVARQEEQPRASERETTLSEHEDEDGDCSNMLTILQPPEHD
jgi:hypothetical protein